MMDPTAELYINTNATRLDLNILCVRAALVVQLHQDILLRGGGRFCVALFQYQLFFQGFVVLSQLFHLLLLGEGLALAALRVVE